MAPNTEWLLRDTDGSSHGTPRAAAAAAAEPHPQAAATRAAALSPDQAAEARAALCACTSPEAACARHARGRAAAEGAVGEHVR